MFGKAGRVESPTDPAPLSMIETTIALRPRSEWRRKGALVRGSSRTAAGAAAALLARSHLARRLRDQMDAHLRVARRPQHLDDADPEPHRHARNGVRTPIGVKIIGPDLAGMQSIGERLEVLLALASLARARRRGGRLLPDFELDRDALARHGLAVADANERRGREIGGVTVTTTIDGCRRQDVRASATRARLPRQRAATAAGAGPRRGRRSGAAGELAEIRRTQGPSMIRDENGQLASYVCYVDLAPAATPAAGGRGEGARRASSLFRPGTR